MTEHCVIDLNHPPRFRCQCCGAEEELELPLPVDLVVRMGRRFEREHLLCVAQADG